ncbi:MAG: SGNH/GDSL hydrolase family protein [Glaciecola sp.]
MAISKLVAGAKGAVGNSTGAEIAETVNGLIDLSRTPYQAQSFTNSTDIVDNSVNLATYTMLMMVPVEYDAIRIGWFHAGGGGNLSNLNMVVASTDNIGDLTYTNTDAAKKFITPEKDGVEYNSISTNGWRGVTWGGAGKLNITDPADGNYKIEYSDLISLNSVPHANNLYSGFRAVLVRVFPGDGVFSRGSFAGFSDPSKFLSECGDSIVLGATRGGGDHVANLAGWERAFTPSFSDSSVMPMMVEALSMTSNKVSVLFAGDSRFASASITATSENRAYQTLQWKSQQAMIDLGLNAGYLSCSKGGRTTDEYFSVAVEMLKSANPSHAVYLAYSSNDGAPTVERMANSRFKMLQFIALCKEKSIQPLILTSFPTSTGYTNDELSLLSDLDSYVASYGARYISPLKEYGTANGDWKSGFNEDANHMTDAGYNDLAEKIARLI